jgi:hypothetical protein
MKRLNSSTDLCTGKKTPGKKTLCTGKKTPGEPGTGSVLAPGHT